MIGAGDTDALTLRSVLIKTGKSNRWTHQAVARILDRMQPRARSCILTRTVGELRTGWRPTVDPSLHGQLVGPTSE